MIWPSGRCAGTAAWSASVWSVASRRRCRSVKRTSVIILGESLGGVESLIEHPGKMTHASVAGTQLEVPGDLIRLSVGIEDAEDLIADLDRALA